MCGNFFLKKSFFGLLKISLIMRAPQNVCGEAKQITNGRFSVSDVSQEKLLEHERFDKQFVK